MTSKITIETVEHTIKLTQHEIVDVEGGGATSNTYIAIIPPGATHVTHVFDGRRIEIEEVK